MLYRMSTVVNVVAPKFSKVTEGVTLPGQTFPEGTLTEAIPASTWLKPCWIRNKKEKISICFIIEKCESREIFYSICFF